MPIVQVRPTLEKQWLTVPFPPTPNLLSIIRKWQQPAWKSELLVYPGGYMGNVSPVGWRTASSFLLNVADDGESADMIVIGVLPSQKTPSDIITELQNTDPGLAHAVSSRATVDQENKCAFVSTASADKRLAIGGLVLHADREELTLLQTLFQKSPVQIPNE